MATPTAHVRPRPVSDVRAAPSCATSPYRTELAFRLHLLTTYIYPTSMICLIETDKSSSRKSAFQRTHRRKSEAIIQDSILSALSRGRYLDANKSGRLRILAVRRILLSADDRWRRWPRLDESTSPCGKRKLPENVFVSRFKSTLG
ncbi:hypothetical protein EVAR_82859_1 [Eumeta japonica]|uniref:Uncharacterized protein n=1 Tax=Eumeta variegata TaxID=151549 RepID=A0A4C1V3A1_EUMVA|nr:hypothetical protein EVAR_82859_1 [Eumeta japonica]